jgi:glyceraldehyde 3-phosphate dehydrogenase (phosphorylating)
MGFGEIPRHIFRLATGRNDIEIVVISEIGEAGILKYLVEHEVKKRVAVELDGNFLVTNNGRARVVKGCEPGTVPWDIFDVDFVVDGTWKYNSREELQKHIDSGAKRVIIPALPTSELDRIVIKGVNEGTIMAHDKLISAGSATSNATAVMLKILDENFGVENAMLTSVHSYTSDQSLRDTVNRDCRRSRSAAENIIPLETSTPDYIKYILPELAGKVDGSMLNVPVPNGSLLDLTSILKTGTFTLEQIHQAVEKEALRIPEIIKVVDEPIVSTDVIDLQYSVIFDKMATMRSPGRMLKTLTWYHAALAMAARTIDVMVEYHKLNNEGGAQ